MSPCRARDAVGSPAELLAEIRNGPSEVQARPHDQLPADQAEHHQAHEDDHDVDEHDPDHDRESTTGPPVRPGTGAGQPWAGSVASDASRSVDVSAVARSSRSS